VGDIYENQTGGFMSNTQPIMSAIDNEAKSLMHSIREMMKGKTAALPDSERDSVTELMKHNCNCDLQMVLIREYPLEGREPEERWVELDTACALILYTPADGKNPRSGEWTDEEWNIVQHGFSLTVKTMEISERDLHSRWYIKDVRQPGQSHFHGMMKNRVHFPEQV
jgi:hypothetical protein